MPADLDERLRGAGCFADDLEALVGVEDLGQTKTDYRVVVHEQQAKASLSQVTIPPYHEPTLPC